MADFYGDFFTGDPGPANVLIATPTVKPAVVVGQYTVLGTELWTTADFIYIARIPKNFHIQSYLAVWDDLDSGTSLVGNVGLQNADTGAVIDADFFSGGSTATLSTGGFDNLVPALQKSTVDGSVDMDVVIDLTTVTASVPIAGAKYSITIAGALRSS